MGKLQIQSLVLANTIPRGQYGSEEIGEKADMENGQVKFESRLA